MRTIHILLTTILLAGAIGFGACAGGGGESSEDTPAESSPDAAANEDDLAQSLLLVLSDFPTGWAEEPDNDNESPFDECGYETSEGRTGRAETGTFSDGGSSGISQTLATFETSSQVDAALDRLSSAGDCFVRVVAEGKLDDEDAIYSDASFSPLSFPDHGDRSEAYRLSVHAEAKGETGFGSEADVYIDLVAVVVGRVGFTVSAVDILTPFDSDELDEYVSIAEARVRDELLRATSPESNRTTPDGPSATVRPSPSPTAVVVPHIGDAQETSPGNTLTVYSYDAPVSASNQFSSAEPGNVFGAIDVEGCTGSSPSASMSVNPYQFRLQMPDNTRIDPTFSAKEPALNDTNLLADDCVRGFITFEVPEGLTPTYVVYEGYDDNYDPLVLKWKVGP